MKHGFEKSFPCSIRVSSAAKTLLDIPKWPGRVEFMKPKDIGKPHWLGELYESGGWRRLTLFHIVRNNSGSGSTSWPIAEIDIIDHPSQDGTNPHKEIKISLRNEIRRSNGGIEVDKNKSILRHPNDIVDQSILNNTVTALQELGFVSLPFSVWICMRHVEDFRVEGDFWNRD
jgi:hypothetical protein